MRYSEITSLPSTPDEAKNSMLDLLAVYQSKEVDAIPMEDIISVLHNQGFDASPRWVMDTLTGKSGVKRITKDEVQLQTDTLDDVLAPDEQQQSADKVSRMAAKAAKKGISNG